MTSQLADLLLFYPLLAQIICGGWFPDFSASLQSTEIGNQFLHSMEYLFRIEFEIENDSELHPMCVGDPYFGATSREVTVQQIIQIYFQIGDSSAKISQLYLQIGDSSATTNKYIFANR